MRDEFKKLRPLLEDWGSWRRLRLNIGYPTQATSCNPDLHIAKLFREPSFTMPAFRNHISYQAMRLAKEKQLREHYHIKANETKPQRRGKVPNYNPHSRMNLIDRRVYGLSDALKQVVLLRYEQELKTKEIPNVIGRTLETVNKRLAKAHKLLSDLPDKIVSHETLIKS